jgi:hypothetical protein
MEPGWWVEETGNGQQEQAMQAVVAARQPR